MSDERANRAIDRLAEVLHQLGYTDRISINPDARLVLGPGKPDPQDANHVHVIRLNAGVMELLAEAAEQILSARNLYDSLAAVARQTRMGQHVDDVFGAINPNQITEAVLNETAPKDRLSVICALEDVFGAIPTDDDEEAEG